MHNPGAAERADCARQSEVAADRLDRPICRYSTPTKYELVINLRTAKALGLDVMFPYLTRHPHR